jgi:hypothetical protein
LQRENSLNKCCLKQKSEHLIPQPRQLSSVLKNWDSERNEAVQIVSLMGWTTGVRLPAGAGNSLRRHVQTGSEAHQASYPMGTEVFSPGLNRPGHETDQSSSSNAQVKNAWSYTFHSPYVFMVRYLVKHRNNFITTYIRSRQVSISNETQPWEKIKCFKY